MMNKLVILNVAAVIASVICYDFEDFYYNQILATDLEEMQDSLGYSYAAAVEHPRARRDEEAVGSFDKCAKRRSQPCCDIKFAEHLRYLRKHSNELREVKQYKTECLGDVRVKKLLEPTFDPFSCNRNRSKRRPCMVQCIGRKFNLVGDDGNLKEAQVTASVRDKFKESWLVPHLDTIISKCLTFARNVTAQLGKTSATDFCNPAAILGGWCLLKEIQMACPEDQIKNVKGCSKFRQRAKQQEERFITTATTEDYDDYDA